MKGIDYSLYVVSDRGLLRGRPLVRAVEQAILGGATIVQLREKAVSTREFVKLAQEVLAVARQYGVPLIINDRIDVMLAVDADGAHVGQEDMPAVLAGVDGVALVSAVFGREDINDAAATLATLLKNR
ncbi:MAG: thiamine phosphate synthase [Firmicutes bacterium]|nr:thiamine phosphate synthase [Bacillota bacterium]